MEKRYAVRRDKYGWGVLDTKHTGEYARNFVPFGPDQWERAVRNAILMNQGKRAFTRFYGLTYQPLRGN